MSLLSPKIQKKMMMRLKRRKFNFNLKNHKNNKYSQNPKQLKNKKLEKNLNNHKH